MKPILSCPHLAFLTSKVRSELLGQNYYSIIFLLKLCRISEKRPQLGVSDDLFNWIPLLAVQYHYSVMVARSLNDFHLLHTVGKCLQIKVVTDFGLAA